MKKLIAPLMLMLVLLMAVGLVSAQSNLPGSGWKSGQTIQNVGGSNATIVFDAYNTSGQAFPCGQKQAPPGGSVNFLTDVDCATVQPGFVGSAVVSADQPIAATVNVNNKPTGAAAGQYTGTDGSNVATTINFPLVKHNHSGRTTTFYVQNASTSPNTITATFIVNGVTKTKNYSGVAANAMVVITPADAGVAAGQGQVGALTVTGTQPMAGSALEHEHSAAVAQNLQAWRGFTPNDLDKTVFCPLVRNAYGSRQQTTGINVQNVSNANLVATITYKTSSNQTIGPFQSPSLAPGQAHTFAQSQQLAAGTLASATITSNAGNIAAVVNDRSLLDPQGTFGRFTTYACFPGKNATTTINLPQVVEFRGSNPVNTTGPQVQNVGSQPTKITMTYTLGNGSKVVFETVDAIPAGGFANFYGTSQGTPNTPTIVKSGSAASTANQLMGAVATASQPIVVVVNESSVSGSNIQDTKNYEGFNQ
jgi:hypothetical protein